MGVFCFKWSVSCKFFHFCYTLFCQSFDNEIFRRSSAVEQLTVNLFLIYENMSEKRTYADRAECLKKVMRYKGGKCF